MIASLVELKKYVQDSLSSPAIDRSDLDLQLHDVTLVSALELLQPFDEVTTDLSSQHYPVDFESYSFDSIGNCFLESEEGSHVMSGPAQRRSSVLVEPSFQHNTELLNTLEQRLSDDAAALDVDAEKMEDTSGLCGISGRVQVLLKYCVKLNSCVLIQEAHPTLSKGCFG
ncbi:hypothetical protein OUZ56_018737 [Daphnia magna]|uniref:Uncharacterized protein n=1 Tax=Daphnia magna TaxID=35525 RepID=A0ABQ9Z9U8_9CRUS|nr:hypothetical protein OUZ56_018737 [Daphnia magna]